MWPFTRKRHDSGQDGIDRATRFACDCWRMFETGGGLPVNLHLRDRISFFAADFRSAMLGQYPDMATAPDEVLLLIICKGIEQSGSHSRAQIERQLGISLPA